MKHVLGVLLLGLCCLVASAQIIDEIEVRSTTGAEVAAGIVRQNMQLKVGNEYTPEKLSADIKSILGTGQFENIEPELETLANGHLRLVMKVTPRPTVSAIRFEGNQRLSDKRLRKEIEHAVNAPLNGSALATDLSKLYKLYSGKGYTDVRIEQRLVNEGDDTVAIVYRIDEGMRAKTRGISILGNHALSDRQIRKVMQTDVSFWGYIFPTGHFDSNVLRADLDRIVEAYWNRGYLDVDVQAEEPRLSENAKKVYVTIQIDEGQPYIVSAVAIEGNERFTAAELVSLSGLKAGDTYSREREQADLRAISGSYNRLGYLDVGVNAAREPDSATHTVKLTYRINEGLPSTIRNIEISGNQITKDHVIRRELEIVPGDLSDGTKIDASRQRLLNLGYFSSVDVVPVPTSDPAAKDLHISVEEKDTGRLTLGAGFSSASNVVGTVELAQTNFDIANWPTMRGGGQRFRLGASLGTSQQEFIISFTEPWLFDRRLRFDWSLWSRSVSSNRDWDQGGIGSSVTFTRQLDWAFWRQSFGYRIELITIDDIDSDYSAAFIDENEGDELVSAVSLGFTRDRRNRPINPSYGSVIQIRGELGSQVIGSYADVLTWRLGATQYLPIFAESILKLDTELSQVASLGGDEPKVFDRLFAGGLTTLRGFDEREVGPFDPNNEEPVGGKSRFLASMEILKPLYEDIFFGALWTDVGNVWADEWDYDFSQLNVGAGLGVRIFLPVGAFQLDYGWPIVRDQENLDKGGRFHFSIGYTF